MTNRRRWSIVCLLSLGTIIAYVDRANLSVALADQGFVREFNLTNNDRGLLNSAFFWAYAVLQIPAGILVDRFGVKFPFAIGCCAWSLVSALGGVVTSGSQLLGLRILLGVGESVVTPGSLRWIRVHVDERQRGLAVGIFMSGTKLGSAIGAPLAGLLLVQFGWRVMFLILGASCVLWLVPWLLLVKNDDRSEEDRSAGSARPPAMPFLRLFSTRLMWGILIGTFAYNYFVYFCLTWLPAYFAEMRGLSLAKSSLYTGFSFGGMAVVAILAGFAADRIIQRGGDPVRTRKAFIIAGLLLASLELIGAFSTYNTVAQVFSFVSLSGLGLTTANYWALTQTLMPGASIGRMAGIQNCASNVAGALAGYLTGLLLELTGSYRAPMYAVGVLLILGMLAYLFMVHARYAPVARDPNGV
jgi:ACS family D-galactonate transporter-like MFS transporter